MERLNTLLAQMQSEDTTLADSVKLYAEAASLMEYCHAALEKPAQNPMNLISARQTCMKQMKQMDRLKRRS